MFEPARGRTSVLIVDGDRRVRRSLSGILEASGLVEVVGCVSTAVEALDLTAERCPDAVLIDLDRPDAEAWLELISQLRGAYPGAAIVALSAAATLRDVSLRAGADAFLSKLDAAGAFSEALVAVSLAGPRKPSRSVLRIECPVN